MKVMIAVVFDEAKRQARVTADDEADMVSGLYFMAIGVSKMPIFGPEVMDAAAKLARVVRRKVGVSEEDEQDVSVRRLGKERPPSG